MTKQEIYNYFWNRASEKYFSFREDAELYVEAAEALFKQIPKRPVPKGSRECLVCPMCSRPLRQPIAAHTLLSGRKVGRRGDSFCPSCGQAIDWGDANDCGTKMEFEGEAMTNAQNLEKLGMYVVLIRIAEATDICVIDMLQRNHYRNLHKCPPGQDCSKCIGEWLGEKAVK